MTVLTLCEKLFKSALVDNNVRRFLHAIVAKSPSIYLASDNNGYITGRYKEVLTGKSAGIIKCILIDMHKNQIFDARYSLRVTPDGNTALPYADVCQQTSTKLLLCDNPNDYSSAKTVYPNIEVMTRADITQQGDLLDQIKMGNGRSSAKKR